MNTADRRVQLSFRERLADAIGGVEVRARVDALAALAEDGLGFVETIQLDRACSAAVPPTTEISGYQRVRVAVLSSGTVDHLLPPLRVAGLRRGLLIDAMAGGFGQYRSEVLTPDPRLAQFQPEFVVLSLSAREAMARAQLGDAAGERASVEAVIGELLGLWRAAREKLGAGTVVQQSFLDVFEPVFGSQDRAIAGTPARLVARLNERLFDAIESEGVLLLDVARAAARDGLDCWYDATRWLQGKMEIAPGAGRKYGELLARLIAAQRGRSRKCLILDLDNTLWGGVVGDVGTSGLVLGPGTARGEAHLALQRYAADLKQRGVILAVCSKNDPSIAETAFREHPEMVLRREDIAAFVANWEDKAANLRRIAGELNIGLESLVFVDDNPAERARVRQSLPMVAVPELPADPSGYVRCVAEGGHFESVALTEDDRRRAEQYAANVSRGALKGSAQNMDEFLAGLQMELDCGPVRDVDLARVVQLVNKTNQFNTTGRRTNESELTRLVADPLWCVLQLRLSDRFGDNGLISALLMGPAACEKDALEIDAWVMSCRVFGRQVEREAMNVAVEFARARNASRLYANYLPTERNRVIENLFAELGFAPTGDAVEGRRRFVLDVDGYLAKPTFIRRKGARE